MIGLPPYDRDAALMKSIWPPTPDIIFLPIESAHTWPVRSISTAELMAVTLAFLIIWTGLLV